MGRIRGLLAIVLLLAGGAALADSRLKPLNTGDDGKGWDAVGRLNLGNWGFCTGALIAPDLVLTAAHCLYDRTTGAPMHADAFEFLAGWRNGRAEAYRNVRRGVVHPRYVHMNDDRIGRVAHDIAVLQLDRPIRLPDIQPFEIAYQSRKGDAVGVVSYAEDRAEAPALQEACNVLARQPGVLMLSCDVDFGSSGAPVFRFENGSARIVSVVSSKADLKDRKVALSASVDTSLQLLLARIAKGENLLADAPRAIRRFGPQTGRSNGGPKFLRP